MTDETQSEVKDIRLSGEEVFHLNDKHFHIYALPFYEVVRVEGKPDRQDLIAPVELANGVKTEWRVNKTTQKAIMALRGRDLKQWVGFKAEWITKLMIVGKDEKQVIYLKP